MKTCALCEQETSDASPVQVVPATWTKFNSYVDICVECRASERFQKMIKQRRIVTPAAERTGAAPARASSTVPRARGERVRGEQKRGPLEIAHRRSGALLKVIEEGTLAQAALPGAELAGADLNGAVLTGADLHRADLHLADLAGADLRRTDLRGTNLRGADLRGADLRDAQLQRADLNFALYNDQTRWPAGFDLQACGAKLDPK